MGSLFLSAPPCEGIKYGEHPGHTRLACQASASGVVDDANLKPVALAVAADDDLFSGPAHSGTQRSKLYPSPGCMLASP